MSTTDDDIVCEPVWPSAAIESRYFYALLAPIKEMSQDFIALLYSHVFQEAFKSIARDSDPVDDIRKALDKFAKRWTGRWASMEEHIAQQFAKGAWTATDNGMRASFAKAGFTIKFKPTRPMLLAYNSRVQANVDLIRSIPQQYLKDVSQKVWDAVTTTGDMNQLTQDIQAVYGVTQRRAAFIARDQNNKAKSNFEETRRAELGIEEAEWQHSAAGKEPRETHIKAGRERVRYSVIRGWVDPEDNKPTWPGHKPNCRCTSRAVIPGLRRRKHYQDPEALRAQLNAE